MSESNLWEINLHDAGRVTHFFLVQKAWFEMVQQLSKIRYNGGDPLLLLSD